MSSHKTDNQKGFTIIELMIATAVLSTILLLVTAILLSIGSLYEKGVNQTSVEDDVRTIANDVTQDLELNDSTPIQVAGVGDLAYCIDSNRYTYVLDNTLDSNGYDHVLWRDQLPPDAPCTAVNLKLTTPSSGGTELMAPGAMLTYFCIDGVDASGAAEPTCPADGVNLPGMSPWSVSVGVAHGLTTDLDLTGLTSTCINQVGEQFCATANLTTSVSQRIL